MSEKRAPVQGFSAGIPWSMHLRAYDAYSKKWSPQPALIDLEGRGCRGGFSVGELDEFIPGWREELSDLTAAQQKIAELEADVAHANGVCIGMAINLKRANDALTAERQRRESAEARQKQIQSAWKDDAERLWGIITAARERYKSAEESLRNWDSVWHREAHFTRFPTSDSEERGG